MDFKYKITKDLILDPKTGKADYIVDVSGDNGGGGGGGVVVKEEGYPVIFGNSVEDYVNGLNVKPFNVDKNKALIQHQGAYGSTFIGITNLTDSGFGTEVGISGLSNISNFSANTIISEDDSFILQCYNSEFRYLPINNYSGGTVITLNPTETFTNVVMRPIIINNTTFAYHNYSTQKTTIIKLVNGALIEDKVIPLSGVYGISSFEGKLVLQYYGSSEKGIRIMDIDTEEFLYEDVSTDRTDYPFDIAKQKDNYLFVPCWGNVSPYATTPLTIYEYSNGQFSKKTMTVVGYKTKSVSVTRGTHDINVYKENGKYLVAINNNTNLDYRVLICDLTNNIINTTKYIGDSRSITYISFATVDNKIILTETANVGSSPTYSYLYYGSYDTDKQATLIAYNGKEYSLSGEDK